MGRTIKSFVLRTGRVSKRQQWALDNCLSDYQIPMDGNVLNIPKIFGRKTDTVIDIGFGMGEALLVTAKANPHRNFIGIEVHRAGVGSLVAELYQQNITNVRLIVHDAVEVFEQQLASNTISGVQIFFPDPWYKRRHNKRRLIQSAFIQLVVDRLLQGGSIHCVTDWQDYAEYMRVVLSTEISLYNSQIDGGFSPKPLSRPITKFEQRGRRLGHDIWDLIFIKR